MDESRKHVRSRVGFALALAVKNYFQVMVKALPDGVIMQNDPVNYDEIGAERARLYERFGFGKDGEYGQFGVVRGGKLVPLTNNEVFYILAFEKSRPSTQ